MKIVNYDVVCIGSGVAGLTASIFAAQAGARVCIVSKEPLGWGNTRIAGGIIASVKDNKKGLYEDMLKAGSSLNQSYLIDSLLKHGGDIHEWIEEWGHIYQRKENETSEKTMIKPGGHSDPRAFISSFRGVSLSNVLRNRVLLLGIDLFEEKIVCEIILKENKAYGVLTYDWKNGEWLTILASQTILACGGAGMLYAPHSDNMRSATGDGYALGLSAGASLVDMEQIQFMPFGVAYPRGMIGLELGDTSAAGPYGVLRNKKGEVFLDQLPNRTREEVSRAIALEIKKGDGTENGAVWLDPTENRKYPEGEESWRNWKTIGSLEPLRMAYGSKEYQWAEKFEVIPTQHYCMGGIVIDSTGRTEVSGLLAVGETSGGLHGGGRMGSMSLLEGLVFGRLVGDQAVGNIQSVPDFTTKELIVRKDIFMQSLSKSGREMVSPFELKRELASMMWNHAGMLRNREMLVASQYKLEEMTEKSTYCLMHFGSSYNHLARETIELRFMLLTAKAIVLSALERNESRGSHYRSDCPQSVEDWKGKNVIIRLEKDRLQATKRGA